MRLAASLSLIAASAVLLLWGFWPERRTVQVLRLDPLRTSNSAVVQPVRRLKLEYPENIRLNDRALIRLAFEVEPEGAATAASPEITDNSETDATPPIAEARLEVPSAAVRPPDSIHEALAPGRPLEFYWTVVLSAPGEYRGTAWSFLATQERSSGPPTRIALGAQNVQLRGVALLGMSGEAARIVGGLSLIGSLVLGLPFVERAARWLSGRGGRGT